MKILIIGGIPRSLINFRGPLLRALVAAGHEVVAAAAPSVPQTLLDQIKDGGRMVIPVGNRMVQELTVIRKTSEGIAKFNAGGCRFVPLLGEHGWNKR